MCSRQGRGRGPIKAGQQAGHGDTVVPDGSRLGGAAIPCRHAQSGSSPPAPPAPSPGLPSQDPAENAGYPPAFARAVPRRSGPSVAGSQPARSPACRQGPWSQDRPPCRSPAPRPQRSPQAGSGPGRAPTGPPSRRQSPIKVNARPPPFILASKLRGSRACDGGRAPRNPALAACASAGPSRDGRDTGGARPQTGLSWGCPA